MAMAGRRRKVRHVRDDDVADDALVVLRAVSDVPELAVRAMALDAADSGSIYVVIRPNGQREVLYGLSFFAWRSGRPVEEVLIRFSSAAACLQCRVGDLRAAGFETWATGVNP